MGVGNTSYCSGSDDLSQYPMDLIVRKYHQFQETNTKEDNEDNQVETKWHNSDNVTLQKLDILPKNF